VHEDQLCSANQPIRLKWWMILSASEMLRAPKVSVRGQHVRCWLGHRGNREELRMVLMRQPNDFLLTEYSFAVNLSAT
jgi:hypothetical protein